MKVATKMPSSLKYVKARPKAKIFTFNLYLVDKWYAKQKKNENFWIWIMKNTKILKN